MEFYNWQKTFSFDADETMVVSLRGKGKTYGLREQFIRDWKKDKARFVEIVRHKSDIQDTLADYFAKVELTNPNLCKGYIFDYRNKRIYIAKEPKENTEGKKAKPKWHVIGYCVALTEMQKSKKKTFIDVKSIVMDEAILEYQDPFHRYLPREYSLITDVVDSCTREHVLPDGTVGGNRFKPHVYYLANAVDLVNPIFMRFGIVDAPEYGYSWHDGKRFLLHYVEPGADADEKRDKTLAGRMARGTEQDKVNAGNKFLNADKDFIEKKTPNAKFSYGMRFKHETFAVWVDFNKGLYFVNSKVPKNTDKPIYALTTDDNKLNYPLIKRTNKLMQNLVELYYLGMVRYESAAMREKLIKALSLFGVR